MVCDLCQNDIKLHSNVYESEFFINFICDDCFLSFSTEDMDFMLNTFKIYGGYYGKDKNVNLPDARLIEQLAKEVNVKKIKENIDVLELRALHKALLHGISIEKFDKELKPLTK